MTDPNVFNMQMQEAHAKMLATMWMSAFVPFWIMWGFRDVSA